MLFLFFYPKDWAKKQRLSAALIYQFIIQWVYTVLFHDDYSSACGDDEEYTKTLKGI